MVRSHSPFSRAYALAEQLCSTAKATVRQTSGTGAAIDWHVGETRPGENTRCAMYCAAMPFCAQAKALGVGEGDWLAREEPEEVVA